MDQYEVFANGNYKVFYCKYHLEAERIGGARVHFGETLDGDHEFEIQEVPMKPQPKAFEK
jgi:hypothetical protein